jgi:hypothetical protein
MYCERMHATISVKTCLARQKARPRSALYYGGPLECRDCEQGKLAATGQLNDEDVEKLKAAAPAAAEKDEGKGKVTERSCELEGCDRPAKSHGYCSVGHRREAVDRKKKAKKPKPKEPPKKAKQDPKLTIDFSEHQELLEVLKGAAEDEVRTPEQQAIYILQQHLCHNGFVIKCPLQNAEIKPVAD